MDKGRFFVDPNGKTYWKNMSGPEPTRGNVKGAKGAPKEKPGKQE